MKPFPITFILRIHIQVPKLKNTTTTQVIFRPKHRQLRFPFMQLLKINFGCCSSSVLFRGISHVDRNLREILRQFPRQQNFAGNSMPIILRNVPHQQNFAENSLANNSAKGVLLFLSEAAELRRQRLVLLFLTRAAQQWEATWSSTVFDQSSEQGKFLLF